MAWELVLNEPLRVVGDWPLVGAHPVAQAIQSFAVPILVRRDERLAPLATGALFRTAERVYLITAAHALEAAPSLSAAIAGSPGEG